MFFLKVEGLFDSFYKKNIIEMFLKNIEIFIWKLLFLSKDSLLCSLYFSK